jgi:hypothetical protein
MASTDCRPLLLQMQTAGQLGSAYCGSTPTLVSRFSTARAAASAAIGLEVTAAPGAPVHLLQAAALLVLVDTSPQRITAREVYHEEVTQQRNKGQLR